VIERPAAAVKELVENAPMPAPALTVIEAGGRRLIRVTDDGQHECRRPGAGGGAPRHVELPTGDQLAIRSLGFRGEALPDRAVAARHPDPRRGRSQRLGTRRRRRRQGRCVPPPAAARASR
jgi:DNA mismatch repair protein MutL